MRDLQMDLVVIGGGPAGLAAAAEAKRQGVDRVCILERDFELGGILQQCIHDGFGLHRFGKRLTGCAYAEEFIDQVEALNIEVKLNTIVLEMTVDKVIYAMNEVDGFMRIQAGAIILAMGCRERTRSQVFIWGSRPSGVLTAGAVQRYINMEGYLPGKKAVILGSGDIGLIMARRMTWEGMDVEGVYEVMDAPGGLTRNLVQCLHDYQIPLHLSMTVVKIHGNKRLTGVTVAKVDKDRKPIAGTERFIDCDLLVLSVGLIPENELSRQIAMEMDPRTKGPFVDESFMTSVPGIFAAGNVVTVYDLVDDVSLTAEVAAKGAAAYLKSEQKELPRYRAIEPGNGVSLVVPQRIRLDAVEQEVSLYYRVKKRMEDVITEALVDKEIVLAKKHPVALPPEMITERLKVQELPSGKQPIRLQVREVQL